MRRGVCVSPLLQSEQDGTKYLCTGQGLAAAEVNLGVRPGPWMGVDRRETMGCRALGEVAEAETAGVSGGGRGRARRHWGHTPHATPTPGTRQTQDIQDTKTPAC